MEQETKDKIKNLAKESGKAALEGLTFSVKTIRQGLQWANEDDKKEQEKVVKKKKKNGSPKVIIING